MDSESASSAVTRVFDSHLHIADPAYPLVENDGFAPAPFSVDQYRVAIDGLKIAGGAVVSGSFQAFDQSYLSGALRRLGKSFVGVTQVPASVSDSELRHLHDAGVRAVRFNLRRGGSADIDDLGVLARRVNDVVGWHTELYVDSRELPELSPRISASPAESIDHLGLHEDGLSALLGLVERGVKVKATGFGRVRLNPRDVIEAIVAIDPTALMVGTDLPSTRAARPFRPADFDVIADTVGPESAEAVFWGNAASFYLREPR